MRRTGLGFALLVVIAGACSGDGSHAPTEAAATAPGARHLIYLHGRIVQQAQSPRPRHPDFGFYELDEILAAFRQRGFVVEGEIRPRGTSVEESADHVVERLRGLLSSGVAPQRITVVGASMGAGIALLAAARLGDPEVRFAVLGACLSANVRHLAAAEGAPPSGHVLAIREASDEATAGCPPWADDAELAPRLVAREIEIDTGLRHGFLYRPLAVWLEPVLAWAGADPPE